MLIVVVAIISLDIKIFLQDWMNMFKVRLKLETSINFEQIIEKGCWKIRIMDRLCEVTRPAGFYKD